MPVTMSNKLGTGHRIPRFLRNSAEGGEMPEVIFGRAIHTPCVCLIRMSGSNGVDGLQRKVRDNRNPLPPNRLSLIEAGSFDSAVVSESPDKPNYAGN